MAIRTGELRRGRGRGQHWVGAYAFEGVGYGGDDTHLERAGGDHFELEQDWENELWVAVVSHTGRERGGGWRRDHLGARKVKEGGNSGQHVGCWSGAESTLWTALRGDSLEHWAVEAVKDS